MQNVRYIAMAEQNVKSKSVKGVFWSFVDNFAGMILSFVIGIVLARLLTPTDYGTVGVISIFVALANVFADSGFGNAIIRKKDRTQDDMSTAFYFNVGVSLVTYIVLYLAAPFVADFFQQQILESILRISGLCVIFNALSIVQNSIFTAQLRIKTITALNIGTQIPMGLVGIYFAYKGFGVWTLVIQTVGASFLKTILLWIVSTWRPSFIFNKDSFHYLFNFGSKLLGANLIGTFFNEIYSFIIGRLLGSSDLGFFSKAKNLAETPRGVIQNVINRVILPIMVETQGNIEHTRSVYSRLIQTVSFLVFPTYFLCISIAKPLILLLWTDKWADTIPLFQIYCIGFAWGPISQLNFSLLALLNRTDMTLKLEFIKKPVLLLILIASIPFGLIGIVIGASLYNIIATFINMTPTKNLLKYGYRQQLADIVKYMAIATVSFIFSYGITYFELGNIISCTVGSIIFIISYLILCHLLHMPAYMELFGIIKSKILKNGN